MHASSCRGSQPAPLADRPRTSDGLITGAQKVLTGNTSSTRADLLNLVTRLRLSGSSALILVTMFIVIAARAWPAHAQSASGNASLEGNHYIDAVLATRNYKTPVSLDNLLATAPGLEAEAPRPQFTLNILAPVLFNSNAQFLSSGGSNALQGSPIVQLAGASQLFGSRIRLSTFANAEFERYVNASDADVDYFRGSVRAQYVNPGNDQGFSPFFSYVPRIDFEPTFARDFATRQDLNLGLDKVFNFDHRFGRVAFASDSSASSVFSLGFSGGLQWRFRNPSPASGAMLLNPSAAYIISDDWNASLSMFTTRRWFESVRRSGSSRLDDRTKCSA